MSEALLAARLRLVLRVLRKLRQMLEKLLQETRRGPG